jgi:hypothetical protein
MIKYPLAFSKHPSAGFDGVMHWDWIAEVIREVDPTSKIEPSDLDCVIERKRHYLVIESKNPGVLIPKGQEILLDSLNRAKDFTVIRLWGKDTPGKFVWKGKRKNGNGQGIEEARELVRRWYIWANS